MYLPSYVLVVSQEGDRAPFGWDKRKFRLVMLWQAQHEAVAPPPYLSLLKGAGYKFRNAPPLECIVWPVM